MTYTLKFYDPISSTHEIDNNILKTNLELLEHIIKQHQDAISPADKTKALSIIEPLLNPDVAKLNRDTFSQCILQLYDIKNAKLTAIVDECMIGYQKEINAIAAATPRSITK